MVCLTFTCMSICRDWETLLADAVKRTVCVETLSMRTTESRLFTFINIWNREEFHILEKNLFCFLMIPDIQEEKSIATWSDTSLMVQLFSLYAHQTTRQVGLSAERNYLGWITGTSQCSNHFQPKIKKSSFIVSTQRYPFFKRHIGGLRVYNQINPLWNILQCEYCAVLCPLPPPCRQLSCGLYVSPRPCLSIPGTWTS